MGILRCAGDGGEGSTASAVTGVACMMTALMSTTMMTTNATKMPRGPCLAMARRLPKNMTRMVMHSQKHMTCKPTNIQIELKSTTTTKIMNHGKSSMTRVVLRMQMMETVNSMPMIMVITARASSGPLDNDDFTIEDGHEVVV